MKHELSVACYVHLVALVGVAQLKKVCLCDAAMYDARSRESLGWTAVQADATQPAQLGVGEKVAF